MQRSRFRFAAGSLCEANEIVNEEESMEESERFAACLLEMGEGLLLSGAEVSRVEDTLTRMGTAYGACEMNVFAITSCIIVTMIMPGKEKITQMKRITKAADINFLKLERLNDLSRRYCSHPFPEEELSGELEKLKTEKGVPGRARLGSILAAASFALFFGGTGADAAAAAVGAVVICYLQDFLTDIALNRVIYHMVCSIAAGIVIGGMGALIPALNPDKVMIGDIMLLIPGIAMTNSVRDVLAGDTIFGLMRLAETILWAGALAAGFMISMSLTGG